MLLTLKTGRKESVEVEHDLKPVNRKKFSERDDIVHVEIPRGVTTIARNSFYCCTSLASITIPKGVTTIKERSFSNCALLTSIIIPDAVTTIGEYVFKGCTSLTSITIPEGMTTIGNHAFQDCGSLTSITIPDSVTMIGGSSFSNCASLKSIIIPEGVTKIGNHAFRDCASLTSITIPESVTTIGESSFFNCASLKSITIPENVTEIEKFAFRDCASLTSITIPEGVTTIGNSTFRGCTSLTLIPIPDSMTIIGRSAFEDCTSVASIVIPKGVTTIGEYSFCNCTSVASINILADVMTIEEYSFKGCTSLTSIIIPEGVTTIGRGAFSNCGSLDSVNFPKELDLIQTCAFDPCGKLLNVVVFEGTMIEDGAFSDVTKILRNPLKSQSCDKYELQPQQSDTGTFGGSSDLDGELADPDATEDSESSDECFPSKEEQEYRKKLDPFDATLSADGDDEPYPVRAECNIGLAAHPSQQDVAQELFKKVCGQLERMTRARGGKPFDDLEFYVQLPGLNSLQAQTVTRLSEFLLHAEEVPNFFPKLQDGAKLSQKYWRLKERYRKGVTEARERKAELEEVKDAVNKARDRGELPECRVIRGDKGQKHKMRVDEAKNQIRDSKKRNTLFLVIQDEAHYDMTLSGGSNAFINSPELRCSKFHNVLTLFVSATPYTFFTTESQIPGPRAHVDGGYTGIDNIQTMERATESNGLRYYGIEDFFECGIAFDKTGSVHPEENGRGMVVVDSFYEAFKEDITKPSAADIEAEMEVSRGSKRDVARKALKVRKTLCTLYKIAIDTYVEDRDATPRKTPSKAPSWTDVMIQELLKSADQFWDGPTSTCEAKSPGKMLLIRMKGGTSSERDARAVHDSIRERILATGMKDRVGVIMDTVKNDKGKAGFKAHLSKEFVQKVAEWRSAEATPQREIGPDGVSLQSYADLEGLPCILILIARGKMGDTFPKSLRFYDLRHKYNTNDPDRASFEQDMGRACRWVKNGPDGPDKSQLPTVIVARHLLAQAKGTHNTHLRWPPDTKMTAKQDKLLRRPAGCTIKKERNKDYKYPQKVFDTTTYRCNWTPDVPANQKLPKNPDSPKNPLRTVDDGVLQYSTWEKAKSNWKDNPSRFALVGRPQIGKTGVFLWLIYLLHHHLGLARSAVDEDEDNDPGSEHDEYDDLDDRGGASTEIYPDSAALANERVEAFDSGFPVTDDGTFDTCACYKGGGNTVKSDEELQKPLETVIDGVRCTGGCKSHKPSCGKYGDPKHPLLWKAFVNEGKKRGNVPLAFKFKKPAAAKAERGDAPSIGSPAFPPSAVGPGHERAGPAPAPVVALVDPEGQSNATMLWSRDNRWWVQHKKERAVQGDFVVSILVDGAEGKLHIPKSHFEPTLPASPVEIPGRELLARWERKEYAEGFPSSEGWIACTECELTRKDGWHPRDERRWLIRCNLPDKPGVCRFPIFTPSAGRHTAGDGKKVARLDLREVMQTLPHFVQITAVKAEESEKYKDTFPDHLFFELPGEATALGVGCSRHYMKELAHALCPASFPFCFCLDDNVLWWQEVTPGTDGTFNQRRNATLSEMLAFFQKEEARKPEHLGGIALLGFEKYNGRLTSKRPYRRYHAYSAYIMNLKLTKRVNFGKKHHIWEDIVFNRSLAIRKEVVCKCHRFCFYKPHEKGGCHVDLQPGPDPTPLPVPNEVLPFGPRMPIKEFLLKWAFFPAPAMGNEGKREQQLREYGKILDENGFDCPSCISNYLSDGQPDFKRFQNNYPELNRNDANMLFDAFVECVGLSKRRRSSSSSSASSVFMQDTKRPRIASEDVQATQATPGTPGRSKGPCYICGDTVFSNNQRRKRSPGSLEYCHVACREREEGVRLPSKPADGSGGDRKRPREE